MRLPIITNFLEALTCLAYVCTYTRTPGTYIWEFNNYCDRYYKFSSVESNIFQSYWILCIAAFSNKLDLFRTNLIFWDVTTMMFPSNKRTHIISTLQFSFHLLESHVLLAMYNRCLPWHIIFNFLTWCLCLSCPIPKSLSSWQHLQILLIV